ncbi:hypothetical protein SK854_08680 [Lentzea sp. BCCO 10_0061]|uniref:Uncharacterized protein n=1 Tax=Lentzea sokolovensis TaxID=3095429 RepID=A0ABU4URR7_9PSEU|nr:hypothetical protein [Lentzea sp. BCCO 10_0061]MDX8142183.1 hypothetical protein [Lentzea sp. BCCO 10_0061]
MKHSDQSAENDISGDVHGTSLQATSMGDVYLGEPARPRWLKAVQYLAVPAVAIVAGATLTAVQLVSPNDPITETPLAGASSVPAETTTASASSSAAGARTPATMVGANRPVPPGSTPRTVSGTSITATHTPKTKVTSAAAPITQSGVRYSGELRFGSFHLDPAIPRDVPESNVWALTPTRLHGDPGYWLAEWHSDGVPGQQECVTHLEKNSTLDADNVVVGSRVCGKTPEGRIFRIDVTVLDGSAITGQVTVWESA